MKFKKEVCQYINKSETIRIQPVQKTESVTKDGNVTVKVEKLRLGNKLKKL